MSTTWRAVTRADIEAVLNDAEVQAYESAVIASGQDPLADAIAAVTGMVRGYIGAYGANTLEPGATLPERAILSASHIIRVELLTRLDMEVSDPRAAAKRDALAFFRDVAAGKVAVEDPSGDGTESRAAASPRVNARTRNFSRDAQEGI
jgi:phage gp36-like protein